MPSSLGTRTNLYADDTMFIDASIGKHHAATKIQTHIYLTSKWLADWRISINSNKTVAILFGDTLPTTLQSIQVKDSTITWSSSVKP